MKKTLIIALAAAFTTMSAQSEEVRVIVKHKASEQSPRMARVASLKPGEYEVLSKKGSEEEILESLRASGQYESVELDVKVSAIRPVSVKTSYPYANAQSYSRSNQVKPNDTFYYAQWYWHNADVFGEPILGSSHFIELFNGVNQNNTVRVGVVDDGFFKNEDIDFHESDSYNFSTMFNGDDSEFVNVRRPEFYDTDFNRFDEGACGASHGSSIASIIGATSNNGIVVAGIANVEIVAARALDCSVGYASDIADAILYLAGHPNVTDAPVISKPVDIINLSLGGPSDYCVDYTQDAINYAHGKGITVVVASGNDGIQASGMSPANCDNIIVVGASNKEAKVPSWSNYGEKVDLVAPGVEVVALGTGDGGSRVYNGTSQAAPMVVGALLLAKSEYADLAPDELKSLLKSSASTVPTNSDSEYRNCENGQCGAGLLNAPEFMAQVRNHMGGDVSYIKHALDETASCTSDLYLDFFGNELSLCSMYEVSFDSNAEVSESVTYQLYKMPIDSVFSLENAEMVLESSEPVIMDGTIDPVSYKYGFTTCTDGSCDVELSRLNMGNTTKPVSCL